MENNITYKITKYSIEIELAIGLLNRNPEECLEALKQNKYLFKMYPNYLYLKYEGVWYQTRLNPNNIKEIANNILNKTYNKEQYLQKIISCI